MKYRLSRQAAEDIDTLYFEGHRQFGEPQADIYHSGLTETLSVLASFPRLARERTEFNPPVRIHPYGSHLIIYLIENQEVVIVRVRHGRENWESALQ